MYNLYAGGCSFNKDYTNGCDTRIRNFVRHANIVQRVKIRYKIKIDYRVLVCCFYGVLQCKQHQQLTIKPLLHSDSATIRVQKRLYCIITVAVLECKSGSIAEKNGSFASLIS